MQLVVVAVLALGAGAVAWGLQRRGVADPEQGPTWTVPVQLDRGDFPRPEAPWLVAVFSSTTCLACADAWEKARVLEADAVAVVRVEAVERKDLHDRYGIDAVPLVLVADAEGLVRESFVGSPPAADLWATLAQLRS